jgi:hypothetical protein
MMVVDIVRGMTGRWQHETVGGWRYSTAIPA